LDLALDLYAGLDAYLHSGDRL